MARQELKDLSLNELGELLRRQPTDIAVIQQELLHRSLTLIDKEIAQLPKTGCTQAELFRAGYMGLLNAVYNIELARDQRFEDYAKNLIKGELRQHVRDSVNIPSPPQWLEDLNRQISATVTRLFREKNRFPSVQELADELNITEAGIIEILKARQPVSYIALDRKVRDADPRPVIDYDKITSKESTPFPVQQRIRIAMALEQLADIQQLLAQNLFPDPEREEKQGS
ncbi:hypothetical protein LM597_02440 [Candidatus Acetothermia bacterium]|nr:hypothetical protein [Candidatus Acetothermia bacterium]